MTKDRPRRAAAPTPVAGGDHHIRPEWVEAAARALVRWMDEVAWDDMEPEDQDNAREAVTETLAAVVPAIQAQALRDWAERVRENYPEDVFIPPTPAHLVAVHLYCTGQGGTLDAISAHLMRHAATLADLDAKAIERGELP